MRYLRGAGPGGRAHAGCGQGCERGPVGDTWLVSSVKVDFAGMCATLVGAAIDWGINKATSCPWSAEGGMLHAVMLHSAQQHDAACSSTGAAARQHTAPPSLVADSHGPGDRPGHRLLPNHLQSNLRRSLIAAQAPAAARVHGAEQPLCKGHQGLALGAARRQRVEDGKGRHGQRLAAAMQSACLLRVEGVWYPSA
jgi:hypothetical protein